MNMPIGRVVILGGGTAGWMTAAYLGKALERTVEIVVLEAPRIPSIGVGEATVPNLQRVFFDYLGIAEEDWMRECNASFKIAVKFINWRTPGKGQPAARHVNGRRDHFYHPFGLLPSQDNVPLSHYWAWKMAHGQTDEPFDYACFSEPAIMDAKRAPRGFDGSRATHYAWHFDAALVADFLRRFAVDKQGVKHIEDTLAGVERDERGFITALRTESGLLIDGDLFIDCSGFRGLLINRAMGEPFVDMSDHLLCDSAVATRVRHDDAVNGIEPYTSSIAMSSGWTWKIPMLSRFGTGYVYSGRFTSQDEATAEFCSLWGLNPEETELSHIRFRVGRNRRAWVRNCVSIGLASCFVEPLESTGIYFIYGAIHQLVKHFPDASFDDRVIASFNREIEFMFDDTRDFLQAHFYFSPRLDTPFWRANKELAMSEAIKQKVDTYLAGLAVNPPISDESGYYGNFDTEFRNFWTNGSYYAILAGMGLMPDHPLPALCYKPGSLRAAERMFEHVRRKQRELVVTLPSLHRYLHALHGAD